MAMQGKMERPKLSFIIIIGSKVSIMHDLEPNFEMSEKQDVLRRVERMLNWRTGFESNRFAEKVRD